MDPDDFFDIAKPIKYTIIPSRVEHKKVKVEQNVVIVYSNATKVAFMTGNVLNVPIEFLERN